VVRGLEPLPLAYDLRNKRVRMRQNIVFSTTTKYEKFSREGAQPLPRPFPSEEGIPFPHTSSPPRD